MALPTPPISNLNILNPISSSPPSTAASTRSAVVLPGLGNNSGDYRGLCWTLADGYGIPTVVAKVSRFDWLRNAAGLLDANYWRGTLRPRPVLNWPAPKGLSGVIDQTRGLLDYVQNNCAPAVYTSQLKYICIAGRYIRGAPLISNPNSSNIAHVDNNNGASELVKKEERVGSAPVATTLRARFIGQGYKQVCGKADVWGDGVVPEMSAHLDGALNISMDGVYHSPVGSDEALRPWYGSPSVVQKWISHLLN